MALPRRARELIAIPLFVIGVPGLIIWGAGTVLTLVGRSLWMFGHRICRDETCTCEECLDFDPEFVRAHKKPEAPPPEAA